MRKRILLVGVVCFALTISIQIPSLAAGIKVGQSCKTKNQIIKQGSNQFKCILKSNKLTWQKVVIKLEPDGFPPNIAAPNRTCLTDGAKASIEGKALICASGFWKYESQVDSPTKTEFLENDGYPSNVPAPNRSCPNEKAKANLWGGSLTCTNGKWLLDKGAVITKPTNSTVSTNTNTAKPNPSPSSNAQQESNSTNLEADGYPPNTPAPDRSCPNEGAKAELYGGKLTCVTGKWKLDPGSTINKPTSPKPVPSNAATPSSASSSSSTSSATPISSNQGTDKQRPSSVAAIKAFEDVKKILDGSPNPKTSYNLQVSPLATKQLATNADLTMPASVKFWQNYYIASKPVEVLLSSWSEKDWMVSAAKNAGDTVNGYQSLSDWFDGKPQSAWQSELGSGVHQGPGSNGSSSKIIIVVSGPDAANRPGGMTTWPHEYVHVAQFSLAPTKANTAPCWFYEGMAQFYGMALTYTDSATFLDKRDVLLKDREFGAYPFDKQQSASYWQTSMLNNESTPCGNNGGYWIGLLAVENLVNQRGTQAVVDLLKDFESTGSFSSSFQKIYGTSLTSFYTLQADYIHDAVDGLLGVPYVPAKTQSASGDTSSVITKVQNAINKSKDTPTSSLIHITIEPGALTDSQETWIRNAIQFISYLSPPTSGGDWDLVFPTTMSWFNEHWDMSKETQHYRDMFANNTAEQLTGSVHSYGTGKGGWAASFFVNTNKSWFNPDWQMRFMAQLLKPTGFSSGIYGNNVPEWYTRTFAYPIGAAYSQITSTGNYTELRASWISLIKTLPKPVSLSNFETPSAFTGPENEKSPGALAVEILLSNSTLDAATNFLKDTYDSKTTWDQQLVKTFNITKAELYLKVSAFAD